MPSEAANLVVMPVFELGSYTVAVLAIGALVGWIWGALFSRNL